MNQSIKTSCKTKRVLIGTYVHKVKYYCIEDWLKRTKQLMDNFPDSDLLIIDNSEEKNSPAWLRLKMDEVFGHNKQTIWWEKSLVRKNSRQKQTRSQELLWNHALKEGYEKLLIIESDVFPEDDFFIKKLYDSGKLIVSGVFPLYNDAKDKQKDVLCIMGYGVNADLKRFWYSRAMFERAIKKVGFDKPIAIYACGLGCIMIDRVVLEKVKPEFSSMQVVKDLSRVSVEVDLMSDSNIKSYLQKHLKHLISINKTCVKEKIHPDTNFFIHCELFGIKRYVLPSLNCGHRRSDWKDVEKVVKR